MRVAIYVLAIAFLTAIAWHYPFLFELPLIATIAGAYWCCYALNIDDWQEVVRAEN